MTFHTNDNVNKTSYTNIKSSSYEADYNHFLFKECTTPNSIQ